MSDRLTAGRNHDSAAAPALTGRPPWRAILAQPLLVLGVFALAGLVCGWGWYHVWDVPEGVVSGGQWFTSEAGLRDDFSGVAWYVLIAAPTGLLLGLLCAWLLDRSELATLVAVLLGSALAGYLMLRLGQHLSPADPHDVAPTAADGTRLPGALRVDSWPPRLAFPFGALLGLAIVYAGSVGRSPAEVRRADSTSGEGTQR